jgi:hypothetical protein
MPSLFAPTTSAVQIDDVRYFLIAPPFKLPVHFRQSVFIYLRTIYRHSVYPGSQSTGKLETCPEQLGLLAQQSDIAADYGLADRRI